MISSSPRNAPGSFTTSPTTCAPGTIFVMQATLFSGNTSEVPSNFRYSQLIVQFLRLKIEHYTYMPGTLILYRKYVSKEAIKNPEKVTRFGEILLSSIFSPFSDKYLIGRNRNLKNMVTVRYKKNYRYEEIDNNIFSPVPDFDDGMHKWHS